MMPAFRRKLFLLSMVLAAGFGLGASALASDYRADSPPGLTDGAGVWANIWNYPEGDLDAYSRELELNGIKNLFIQTSRSNTPAIKHPEKLGPLIEACHRHGVRVIAWSFAELINPSLDADKMIQAAEFISTNGEHIDAIAPNLEKNLEPGRIEQYSKRIREKLGPNYPMIAVVYSPLNRCVEVQRISWPLLAKYYDVIAPMIYWNSKYQKIEPYRYTVETIQRIRELSGKPDIEIHAIGDGMGTNAAAIKEFLQACKTAETTGLSLYPNQKMTAEQTKVLATHPDYLPPNARFRLAAFRSLVQKGILPEPPKKDPSQAISHRAFYQLVVRQMYPALLPTKGKGWQRNLTDINSPQVVAYREANGEEAFGLLANHGLVSNVPDQVSMQQLLDSPLYPREALALLAKMVELEQKKTILHRTKQIAGEGRIDRWLIPAAQAENLRESRLSGLPLNYFDACQMVLQAGVALR